MLLDLAAMRGVHVDSRAAAGRRPGRGALGRRRSRDAGLRARRAGRRGVRHRRRRPDAGRWLRLGAAQVRPVRRRARRGAGRLRRRSGPHRVRRLQPGPVLGAARRRRELRRGHVVHVRAAAAGPGRRLLGDLLPGRGDRRDPARLARVRHGRAGRGHLGRGDDHVPGQPRDARGDPRSRGGDRRRRLRRGRRRTACASWRRCASWARRCSTCRARPRSPHVQSGFDPLFPRNALRAYWKSQYLDELVRRRDRRRSPIGAQSPRAADAGQYVPHGRRDRRGGPRGDRVRRARGAVHGLDRRHVGRPGRRRRHDRLGALGVGRRRGVRQRRGLPELHRSRRRGPTARASTPRSGATSSAWRRSRPSTTPTTSSTSTTTSSLPRRPHASCHPAAPHVDLGRRAIRVGAPPAR